jgi:hypothetical protein
MKIITILYIFFSFLNARDTLVLQQKNVLYIQNLIKIEEKIASSFEKYLLENFSIPTINELKSDDYLGSNFTTTNKIGPSTDLNISFTTVPNLKIKYGIKKDVQAYVLGLYKRDLYRDMTTVNENIADSDKSYVSFELKSKEAENIFKILKANHTISIECPVPAISVPSYCIKNLNTIRWDEGGSNWIEYNNRDFENGNVTITSLSLLSNEKLNNLKVGAFIFVKNGDKYLKIIDNIVKVE